MRTFSPPLVLAFALGVAACKGDDTSAVGTFDGLFDDVATGFNFPLDIGIVPDIRQGNPGNEANYPVIYLPHLFESYGSMQVLLRTSTPPTSLATSLRTEVQQLDQYLPLSMVRAELNKRWTLEPIDYSTGGPARYVMCRETGRRIGFITPMTHNFCESCNRVRLTCTGTLYMCLGQEDAADLRTPVRASEGDELLMDAIDEAIGRKPKGHDFIIDREHLRPAVSRHMSMTGG